NPAVGAVVVKNGQVMGRGFTQPPGGPHAEVIALQEAGDKANGATMYVTLEPHAHQGRTPPCTDAIIQAGIVEVHIATLDPNPNVNGKGVVALKAAGVRVTVGDHEHEAQQVIEAFTKHTTTGLPFVVAKFAMSLDGKIATSTGESQWITGPEMRREVHRLRAECDAIMVGIQTALQDDPQLTVRDVPEPPERQPLRVVVDSNGRMTATARMLAEPGRTLVAVAEGTANDYPLLVDAGAEVVSLPGDDGRVDLQALLQLLGQRGVTSVLVEGGNTLLGALFDLGAVDKVVGCVSPVVIGGAEAPTPVGGHGAQRLTDALRLRDVSVATIGNDVMITGYHQ
ncbi:MAG: bifunctional diaminohydroxyphosphoribosylaminopyrimidine deaminase/5-amino-6-(5-phosphoribosylamino)uracil reductase RibD, partial [Chloroflexi bacterium]|nr:bifunctional diaminohydroxyphosphoribosylaminopyrimidine deaminase/5-amino-6-(5-phosphoribosylamino)uracil reductase RibD [Chloroflexota bacterium]